LLYGFQFEHIGSIRDKKVVSVFITFFRAPFTNVDSISYIYG
jgi:hypothetical protein